MHRSKQHPYSITSSATAEQRPAEQSRPSALAVLRLMTSSTLVGCCDRQVGRLLALEDTIDVAGRAPVLVDFVSIRRQSGRHWRRKGGWGRPRAIGAWPRAR